MELVLDYSVWRCGGNEMGNNILGMGKTSLLNYNGYQCCLGQFTPQLNPLIIKEKMIDVVDPESISQETQIKIPGLSKTRGKNYNNTVLSLEAMCINDFPNTTPDEKIVELKKLFKKHGHTIKVINR